MIDITLATAELPDDLAEFFEPVDAEPLTDTWRITPKPFPGAHFAVMPPELGERCIKAGTSERGCCPDCGAPWRRLVTRVVTGSRHVCPADPDGWKARRDGPGRSLSDDPVNNSGLHGQYLGVQRTTTGWAPTCACPGDKPPVPCTVLDLFAGAGTTGLAADRLGRNAVLIELNGEYCDLIAARLARARAEVPLLAAAE